MPNRRKRPQPLVAREPTMSRKRARHVTTAFHRLMRTGGDSKEVVEAARVEYQRASQVSTTYHSTSKWVLADLSLRGWVYGIPQTIDERLEPVATQPKTVNSTAADATDDVKASSSKASTRQRTKQRVPRRPAELMEIGAINTQLLDAATQRTGYALNVRAIDLHAMDRRIEEADFLQLPLPPALYDVIVCSMVINCLATSAQRGEMLCRLYHFVRPDGLVFLTLPRTCLQLSPYIDKGDFVRLLTALGLVVRQTKGSPKVAFFICQRVAERPWDGQAWTATKRFRNGPKYTNDFAVVLTQNSFEGKTVQKTTNRVVRNDWLRCA